MTKKEAIAKVVKLRRLASGNASKPEADSARSHAARICKENDLTEGDLSTGARVEAFDDLVERLDHYAKVHGKDLPGAAVDVLGMVKSKFKEEDKVAALEKLVGAVRIASFLMGRSAMGGIKDVVEEVLQKHGVSV